MENNITENKKIYLLEVWELRTNEWGDRTKNKRIMMRLVTLINDDEDYKRKELTKIVKKMSKDNVENPDYDIVGWINDETGALYLMSDWGNTRDKGNQWYGVEAVLTPMNKITEI